MPVNLSALVNPRSTAVLTVELQRGVTGDLAAMRALADEVRAAGVIDNVASLCRAAREVSARVVHCTVNFRPDGLGNALNSRIAVASAKLNQGRLNTGEAGAEVMPEIGPQPGDVEVARSHGMTPFTSTSLDQVLRNMGVTTLVVTGNSVNLGVLGTVISGVDLGYQVVVPRDAVAGIPREYADAVLTNTIAMVATICTTDELIAAWSTAAKEN